MQIRHWICRFFGAFVLMLLTKFVANSTIRRCSSSTIFKLWCSIFIKFDSNLHHFRKLVHISYHKGADTNTTYSKVKTKHKQYFYSLSTSLRCAVYILKLHLFLCTQARITQLSRPRFSKTLVFNLGFKNTDLG